MSDLVAFLRARLDEDETNARQAQALWADTHIRIAPGSLVIVQFHRRHDPARVLREVQAERAILERHMPHQTAFDGLACNWCSEDVDDRPQLAKQPWPCPDVRSLAAIYRDHPDYRQEWTA